MYKGSLFLKIAIPGCLAIGLMMLSAPADALNESVTSDSTLVDTQFLHKSPTKLAFFGFGGGSDDDLDDTGGGFGGFWGGFGGHRGDDLSDDAAPPDDTCDCPTGDDEAPDDTGHRGGFWSFFGHGKGDVSDDSEN